MVSPADSAAAADAPRAFTVELRRSGRRIEVPGDRSILDVLRGLVDDGIDVDFFCRRGECGTCVVTVLEGLPLHRDTVLSERARAANRRIAICVSRSVTDVLVLDL